MTESDLIRQTTGRSSQRTESRSHHPGRRPASTAIGQQPSRALLAITGTVTLKDGTDVPFIAYLIPPPGSSYGLFRSEETFHGVRYLGGWTIHPLPLTSTRTGTGTQATLDGVMFPMPICCIPDREGVITNEQTGALIVSPPPPAIASVTVPGLGPFRLTPCREAQC